MDDTAALAQALDRLLEPLVEVLLRGGMPHKAFAELAKRVYVRVAEREGGVDGRKQTTSRIAVLTGLTRKEVGQLRKLPAPQPTETAQRYNRASRVVAGWLRDERFLADGEPAVLPLEGEGVSFATLVREFSGDVPTRAMLDELLRTNTVALEGEQVTLLERGYLPRRGEADKLQILGTDVAGLIATIRRNLDTETDDEAWYQRKVFADNLAVPALPALRALTAEKGQALLEQLAAWMAEHDLDEHPDLDGPGGGRAGIGIYYFEDVSEETPS